MFSNVTSDKATEILENARIDCQYQTLPLKDIKRRVAAGGSRGLTGQHYHCWAIHHLTAKPKACAVLAQSIEGAKVQMEKYIDYYLGLELSEYILFIGRESVYAMSDCRMKILGLK